MRYKNYESGFIFISLLITLVIIAILVSYFYKGSNDGEKSPAQAGKEGIEQTKVNNDRLKQNEIEIQNQLNSQ